MNPVMPDPWGPPSIVDLNVYEIPIREVLSRIDSLTGQLSEYAAAAIRDGATSTEDHRTLKAIDVLSGAAMEALLAWDRWLTAQNAPEAEPEPDRVPDLMAALERSLDEAKAAADRRRGRPAPIGSRLRRHPGDERQLTPDQDEVAQRHLRLQRGED